MSRVDEDREAQRAMERQALKKREEELRAKKVRDGESAFANLIEKARGARADEVAKRSESRALSERDEAKKEREVRSGAEGAEADPSLRRDRDQRARGRQVTQALAKQLRGKAGEARVEQEGRASDQVASEARGHGRFQDAASVDSARRGRSDDQRSGSERTKERKEAHSSHSRAAAQGASSGKEGPRVDPDRGGGQKKGGSQQEQEGELPQGFRFNPALLAPVPVARPKDSPASTKLRALANEIAQKIVERVRVGHNAAGQAEFQIDLKSNVLQGLSIKVSGSGGRIRAVFSGSDREVLKLLREESGHLREALEGRGLKLEDLRIEERT